MTAHAIPCPLCGKPASPETRPFCSPACRDRDLLQWFGEGYRIPGRPIDPDGVDSTHEPD